MRWQLAPGDGAAPCGALVLFSLDVPDEARSVLHALLSDEERARAARFLFPELAARFIVAHARLRLLLADVLGIAAADIELTAGEFGKPRLAGDAAGSSVHFNLSHSGGWGLVGWARQREIGVDVECWRPMRDERALVHRFFSPHEIAAYESLPPPGRTEGFFNCWSRKESYIKAVGRGLGLPLDSFDVSLDRPALLLRTSAHCEDGRRWSLAAPAALAGMSVAVVLESDTLVLLPELP